MKITKTLFTVLSSLFILSANAQVNPEDQFPSLVPQIGLPLGEIKNTNGIILGGHIQYEVNLASKTRMLFQFGGGMLQGKEYDNGYGYKDTYPAVALMQLRVGAKFFPIGGGLFVAGLAGGAHSFVTGGGNFGFSYAPIIGLEFGNGRYYDVSVRYDASVFNTFKVSTASLSIGYHL